jgi:2-polyprenyl-3-methyl-5-hydroxy-6-metoxy-1,4-benzoquinol methylase
MKSPFNTSDRDQWNRIFENPNPAWKMAPEQAFMRDAREFFQSAKAQSVLDIGCGVGVWSIYLARHGFKVSGADFSENAIAACRDWANEAKLDIRFETAPITADPFPGQKFDAAVAAMILDNVAREEMSQAVSLLATKLRPGGALFALFNPFLSESQKEEILRGSNNPTQGITSITYTDEEIQKAFPGFEMENFKKYPLQGLEFRGISLRKAV